jgi:hypothetical protein
LFFVSKFPQGIDNNHTAGRFIAARHGCWTSGQMGHKGLQLGQQRHADGHWYGQRRRVGGAANRFPQ